MSQSSTPPPLAAFTEWDTGTNDGSCVYISHGPDGWVALKETDDPGPVIRIPAHSWATFTDAIRTGRLT